MMPAEGAVRYFFKVTLGRKGMLKVNERWVIPIVFAPRQRPPTYSPLRELALSSPHPPSSLPSSREDPSGWTPPGKYTARETMRAGVFRTKVGEIILEARVPRGKVVRAGGEKVDFEVSVTSSNPEQTGRFPPGAIQVSLVMKTSVTAQRLSAFFFLLFFPSFLQLTFPPFFLLFLFHSPSRLAIAANIIDTPILRASSVRPIGPPGGEAVPYPSAAGAGGIVAAAQQGWKVSYGGSIKLVRLLSLPAFSVLPFLSSLSKKSNNGSDRAAET